MPHWLHPTEHPLLSQHGFLHTLHSSEHSSSHSQHVGMQLLSWDTYKHQTLASGCFGMTPGYFCCTWSLVPVSRRQSLAGSARPLPRLGVRPAPLHGPARDSAGLNRFPGTILACSAVTPSIPPGSTPLLEMHHSLKCTTPPDTHHPHGQFTKSVQGIGGKQCACYCPG